MQNTKASDAVEYLFYCSELELDGLDDFSVQFPEQGKGQEFWIGLRDSCEKIAEDYPDQVRHIADLYDEIWNRWKERR